MSNVPVGKDTAWYLWEILFECKIPQMATFSEEYIRAFGVPSSGRPEFDRDLDNQWIEVVLNIDKMVEYFKKGMPIRVCKHEETRTIYTYIQNHLEYWATQGRYGLNTTRIPRDDLIALDRLASALYIHAADHMKRPEAVSSFMRSLDSFGSGLNFGVFSPPEPGQQVEPFKPREELGEVFMGIEPMANKSWK